jgi:hypothetical protein
MADVGIFYVHLVHFRYVHLVYIFYGHLTYYICIWPFGLFVGYLVYIFLFWYVVARKFWQPWFQADGSSPFRPFFLNNKLKSSWECQILIVYRRRKCDTIDARDPLDFILSTVLAGADLTKTLHLHTPENLQIGKTLFRSTRVSKC